MVVKTHIEDITGHFSIGHYKSQITKDANVDFETGFPFSSLQHSQCPEPVEGSLGRS